MRQTGMVLYPFTVNVHLACEPVPRFMAAPSWDAVLVYLPSPEFRSVRTSAEFVTVTSR